MRVVRWLARFALMAFAVAGCTASPTPEPTGEASHPETTPPLATAAAPTAPPPPPEPEFVPAVFIGLTAAEVEARFGTPVLKRRDGIAQVWQYAAGDCVLHLFFYGERGDAGANAFRVEHVDAKLRRDGQGPEMTAAAACAQPFGIVRTAPPGAIETPAP